MPRRFLLLAAALPSLLAPSPAHADLTACSLRGQYAAAAALQLAEGQAQMTGRFTFQPPVTCAPGAQGLVEVDLSVLVAGSTTPLHAAAVLPYTVDILGRTVVEGFLRGTTASVTPEGLAQALVFEGDVGGTIIRFTGTASRIAAASVAGPPGPAGDGSVGVLDANTRQVGRLYTVGETSAQIVLTLPDGQAYLLRVTAAGFPIGIGTLRYQPPDQTCSTTAHTDLAPPSGSQLLQAVTNYVIASDGTLYGPAPGATVQLFSGRGSSRSQNDGICQVTDYPGLQPFVPAVPIVNLNSLGFTPPFRLQ